MRYALIAAAVLAGCAVPAGKTSDEARTTVGGESPLAPLFTRVAHDSGVPANVLAAVSYVETRLAFAKDSDLHQVGPLALTDGIAASPRDLHRGAALAGVTDEAARHGLRSIAARGCGVAACGGTQRRLHRGTPHLWWRHARA